MAELKCARSRPPFSVHILGIRFNQPYESKTQTFHWLIARQPGNLERSYYLRFLFAATKKDEKAMDECRRILKKNPDNQMARRWREPIRMKWGRTARRQNSARHVHDL